MFSLFNQPVNTVPFISINVQMASASHCPSCVTTGTTVGTTVMKKAVVSNKSASQPITLLLNKAKLKRLRNNLSTYQCTRAAGVMSSHVPADAVSLSAGFVMSSMTVETTAMKKDVVSLAVKNS